MQWSGAGGGLRVESSRDNIQGTWEDGVGQNGGVSTAERREEKDLNELIECRHRRKRDRGGHDQAPLA
jgi:hypothetical protein